MLHHYPCSGSSTATAASNSISQIAIRIHVDLLERGWRPTPKWACGVRIAGFVSDVAALIDAVHVQHVSAQKRLDVGGTWQELPHAPFVTARV